MGSLDQLRRDLERKAVLAAKGTAREWRDRLKRESPYDTGRMVAATTVAARATRTGATIEAIVDTPYAHIVAAGQRPHVIVPRSPTGVLVFDVGGKTVFTRRVSHPGAQPRTWWEDSLRDVPAMLQRNWNGVR